MRVSGILIYLAVLPQWARAEKLGAAVPVSEEGVGSWSPSNTMKPGPRPTSLPSGILIHPAVWPQYTNVTNTRQTDRTDIQRSDSIGRTVLQTVARRILCQKGAQPLIYGPCLLWPNGWMDQNAT